MVPRYIRRNMTTTNHFIVIQVRSPKNEHLVSLRIEYKNKDELFVDIEHAIACCLEHGVLEVESNTIDSLRINGVPVEHSK